MPCADSQSRAETVPLSMTVTLIRAIDGRDWIRSAEIGIPIGADHLDLEARHAARDPLDDVGLAFPDVDVELGRS